jgi:hypothetical protein
MEIFGGLAKETMATVVVNDMNGQRWRGWWFMVTKFWDLKRIFADAGSS